MKRLVLFLMAFVLVFTSNSSIAFADSTNKITKMGETEYCIDEKIIVFTVYNKNGAIIETVSVYEDEEKQVKAEVNDELAKKIERLSSERANTISSYLGDSTRSNVTGEVLTNSAAGTDSAESRKTYACHYSLHSTETTERGIKHTFYNGYSRVLYYGSQTLSHMGFVDTITMNSNCLAFVAPDNYDFVNGTRTLEYGDYINIDSNVCTFYRSNMSTESYTDVNTFSIKTKTYVLYGNSYATATVTSNW